MADKPQFTDDTLNETPERVVKFLGAVGRTPTIWAALEALGYSQKEHDAGWTLVHEASNYRPASPVVAVDPKAAAALVFVDNWEEPNLRRYRSALERLHPARVDYLFGGIEFATGAQSLVNVEMFLDRTDALETGKDRAAGDRDEDKKTVVTLENRGLTKPVKKDLREKIATAKGLSGPAPGPVASGMSKDQHRAALLQLKLWFDDWAETARTAITRRDLLIRLGLAEKKSQKKDEAPADPR